MTFQKFASYLEKLESTSSRNSMVTLLAELFKKAKDEEIGEMVYLLQGRVVPSYEHLEFGMAEKMVIKALAKAYQVDESDLTASFKKLGDVGQVAEQVSMNSSKDLSVTAVYKELRKLPEITGDGSVDKKIDLLASLFQSEDKLANRFLARIPVDKMRLGFSDMTIIDALSWMLSGDKKHKNEIEAAYNTRPDLGLIAAKLKEQGLTALKSIKPEVGVPILGMKAERATSAEEILEKAGSEVAIEPKLDGLRTQLHYEDGEVTLFSRGLEDVTAMYPDMVEAAKVELKGVKSVVLDGEAIGFDPKTGKFLAFQDTIQRKRKYDVESFSKNIPLKLIVFDVLYYNGDSTIQEPYLKRRSLVEKLLASGKILVPATMEEVNDATRLEEIFQTNVAEGREGIMAKKPQGVYQAGARGWNWIKFKKSYASKLADTVDAVVMGYDFGQGQRNKFGIGSFLVGIYDSKSDSFKSISKVGTGLTDDEWRELVAKAKNLVVKEKPANYEVLKVMNCDVWIKPEIVGEFKADDLTKSPMHTAGFAMRFPRLERWREKKAEDTTSLKEIQELAKKSSSISSLES